eukprot:13019.XXX_495593_495836_1 [CDS] Oithona nana genome sequencing.
MPLNVYNLTHDENDVPMRTKIFIIGGVSFLTITVVVVVLIVVRVVYYGGENVAIVEELDQ